MIFDPLRKKNVPDTPEERVRQSVIRWLHEEQGVSMELMMSEYSFLWNGRRHRADIIVFDRELKPIILVECKAPDVPLSDDVWHQALRYNRELDVKKIILCNGRQMKIWER
ncbi:MAG: type I restriction enzyme HsdR N-terminal domain-containing protein [Alistipes sp.]|nr:type I restriction enzyme HsdR N-terminal domain-containing protein [Candidatus Minthomonas equi]